jgi:hypothetical protein
MAQITLDTTGNESLDRVIHHIQTMFTDLYTNGVVTGTNTGITSLPNLATVVLSGLATEQSIKLDTGTKTATASSGAATLNKSSGIITSEALSTAAAGTYTLTLTNSSIAAGDIAMVSVDANGSTGTPEVTSVKTTASTLTVIITNVHDTAAFNAAIKIAFAIFKA